MKVLKRVSFDFWWEVAQSCPYATFFHSPIWAEWISEVYPKCRTRSIGFITDRGSRIVFPLFEENHKVNGLIPQFTSTFGGNYGGPITDGDLTTGELEYIYETVFRSNAWSFEIEGNPYCDRNVLHQDTELTFAPRFTHVISLEKPLETLRSQLSRGHKSSINKARKLGVCIREASDKEMKDTYYKLYMDTIRRWGEDPNGHYGKDFFEAGYRLKKKFPGHIKCWVAEFGKQVIAGALIFYWNWHAVYWHGVAVEDFFEVRANNLLHWEIINDAMSNSFTYYDFNPSGGYKGVEQFKSGFGATRKEFGKYIHKTAFSGVIGKVQKWISYD